MNAAFELLQPVWLAVALVCVAATAVLLRHTPAGASGPAGDISETRGERRIVGRGLRSLAAVGAAALVAAWLVHERTPLAHGLLLAAALGGAGWLLFEVYRNRPAGVSKPHARVAAAARLIAWTALMLLIARPVWDWVVLEWQKPLLVVLLDYSRSMGIADVAKDSSERRRRADRVQAAVADARTEIKRLNGLFDVRLHRFGDQTSPVEDWSIVPETPISSLAAGLRYAGELRSGRYEPAATVLLLSDGAENVERASDVRAAASALAAQESALIAFGAGPPPGVTPLVELEPLLVPVRIGLRDRLRVAVRARVQGCAERMLEVEVLWSDTPVSSDVVRIESKDEQLREEYSVAPPAPGPQRLTVRVTLPQKLGGGVFATSTIVEVQEGRVRVLLLEGPPRSEAAFVTRAWASDPQIEVTRRFLLRKTSRLDSRMATGDSAWSDFDVVVLGNVPKWRLTTSTLAALFDAVSERGVGLLLMGGYDFFNGGAFRGGAVEDLCPVALIDESSERDYQPRFLPTEMGYEHAILRGVAQRESGDGGREDRVLWLRLPALGGAARLGEPKPLASVLARDEAGRPLLVAHEVGAGRCAAAAWESTWPWALASDAGSELHIRFWRQMAIWLANRRPRAWILSQQSTYVGAGLEAGWQSVRIRVGVSGSDASAGSSDGTLVPKLTLRRAAATTSQPVTGPAAESASRAVRLTRDGDEWTAELPSDFEKGVATRSLPPGKYVLELEFARVHAEDSTVRPAVLETTAAGGDEALTARAGFEVILSDLERRLPTANLALLRRASSLTATHGGAYHVIEELPSVLRRLAATDRRRREERRVRYDIAERNPWLLLAILVGALGLEWGVRKRAGMP